MAVNEPSYVPREQTAAQCSLYREIFEAPYRRQLRA